MLLAALTDGTACAVAQAGLRSIEVAVTRSGIKHVLRCWLTNAR